MNDWTLRFTGYDPLDERRREALCTVGNGYFATRGAWAGSAADDHHYPGTYLAGYYNRLTDEVDGRSIENESLVNLPDWLPLTVAVNDGPWLTPDNSEVLDHTTELDLCRGVLTRRFRLRDEGGHVVAGVERRFVSMAEPHLAGQTLTVTAENWTGRLRLATTISGAIHNSGVERYRKLAADHLTDIDPRMQDDTLLVAATTRQSHCRIAVASRTVATGNGNGNGNWRSGRDAESVLREFVVPLSSGQVVTAEKVAAVYGSRDFGISEPVTAALTALQRAPGFDQLLEAHVLAWSHLWRRFSVDLTEPVDGMQFAVRLNLFHLLQAVWTGEDDRPTHGRRR
jgi:trehalose/maltose hydrolase-like predicted phosphorylase